MRRQTTTWHPSPNDHHLPTHTLGQSLLLFFVALLLLHSVAAASVNQTSYTLGENINIETTPGALRLVILHDGESFRYLGTLDSNVTYAPSDPGNYTVEETLSDGSLLSTTFTLLEEPSTDNGTGNASENASGTNETTPSPPPATMFTPPSQTTSQNTSFLTSSSSSTTTAYPSTIGVSGPSLQGLFATGRKKTIQPITLKDDELPFSAISGEVKIHTSHDTGWITDVTMTASSATPQNLQQGGGATTQQTMQTISASRQDILIAFRERHVKRIELRDADTSQSVDLGLDEPDANTVDAPIPGRLWQAVYAVDPSTINFSDGTLSAVASGTELYKCKEWNFTAQICDGTWTKLMNLVPGEEYTIPLSIDDPGFAESVTITGFVPSSNLSSLLVTGSAPSVFGNGAGNAWGISVFNPTNQTINITKVSIGSSANVFGTVTGVKPATLWSGTATLVNWSGSVSLSAFSGQDFIVRVTTGTAAVNLLITVNATTNVSNLSNAGYLIHSATTAYPSPSLAFLNSSSRNAYDFDNIAQDQSNAYTIIVNNTGTAAVPTNTILFITLPPGWTNVTAAAQTGWTFGSADIMGDAGTGWILLPMVDTTTIAATSSRNFIFNATPPDMDNTSLYSWLIRLIGPTNTGATRMTLSTLEPSIQVANTTPLLTAIDNRYAQTWTEGGAQTVQQFVSVPAPIDYAGNANLWGVVVVNPTDTPVNVTQISVTGSANLFGAVTGVLPTTTWKGVSGSSITWNGTVTVAAHGASEFQFRLVANGTANTLGIITFTTTTTAGTLTTGGFETSYTTSNSAYPALYSLNSSSRASYILNTTANTTANFSIVVDNNGSSATVPINTLLQIRLPPGWRNVTAAAQTGWTILQITSDASAGALIRAIVATSAIASGGTRSFNFTATAPLVGGNSTFRFDAQLLGAGGQISTQSIETLTQFAIRVIPTMYGINLTRKSAPVQNISNVSSLSITDTVLAFAPTPFNLTIFNTQTGKWDVIQTATLGTTEQNWTANYTINRTFDPRVYINQTAATTDYGKIIIQWYTNVSNQTALYEDYLVYNTTLDTQSPTITLLTPNNSSYTNGSNVNMTYNASDNVDLRNCTLFLNGVANQTTSAPNNDTPGFFNQTLVDRSYNWSIGCYDLVGNWNQTTNWSFTVDTTAPGVALNLPLNNAKFNVSVITFNYTPSGTNLANCSLFLNNTLNQTNTTPTSSVPNYFTVSFLDGAYNWTVGCYDKASNYYQNISLQNFSIDTTPPTGANPTTQPASGATYNASTIYTFNTTWTDTNGISTVLFQENFTGVPQNHTVTTVTGNIYSYNYTPLGAGTYAWRMYANDTYGNWNAIAAQTYTVNQAPSNISLYLNGTTKNFPAQINDSVNITAVLNIPAHGSIGIYLNGILIASGNDTVTNITSFLTNGTQNVTAVYNATQNYTASNASLSIVVGDARGPATIPLYPANNSYVNMVNITFLFNASDDTGVQNCSLYINGTLNATKTTGLVNHAENNITGTGFSEGSYSYFLSC